MLDHPAEGRVVRRAAAKPSSSPLLASAAAPVHTEAMIRTLLSMARSQSSIAATLSDRGSHRAAAKSRHRPAP